MTHTIDVSTRQLRLAVCCALSGLGFAVAMADTAQAQATNDAQTRLVGVEEIVVTARRREESLQDVPIAVTAVSAEQLELRGAPDFTDLQRSTPSLTLQVSRGTNSTLTAFIRGVGQQDPLWGFEPGVGLYVDDVYLARPQGAVLDILDVERIEVLRGPQGTLYGRNTIGGAIKYVTKRLTDEAQLTLRAEAGSYDELNGVAMGSVPVSETLRIGAAFGRYSRDGYGENLFSGADHGLAKDVVTGRAVVELTPSDAWFFRLSYDRLHDTSNVYHGHREAPGVGSDSAVLPDVFDTRAGLGDDGEVNTEGFSLLAQWRVSDNLTFKSISAYREGETNTIGIDFDNTPAPVLDIRTAPHGGYDDDQFSQELQALLEYDRWQGVVGIYYLDAMALGGFDTILANAVPGLGLTQQVSGRVDTESYAAFADVSFDITDRLKASVGGRYTNDDKDGQVYKANYLGLGSTLSGRNVTPLAVLTDYERSRSFSEFTPRASLSFSATPDLNIYFSYGRGFKSGGFDMRGDAAAYPETINGYDSEVVDSYELGLKTTVLDNRLSLATAIFDQEYKDQQVTSQFPAPPPSNIASVVDNVGKSRIRGFELEGTAFLTERLSATFSTSYLDAEFLEYSTFDPVTRTFIDVADQRRIQNTPEWMGFLGLTYRQPIGAAGELAISGSAAYRDAVSIFETPVPEIDQAAYTLYDASVVWTSPNEAWRFGVYGRNLADKEYRTGGYVFPGALFNNSLIGFYGPPRTIRASLQYRF